MEVRTLDVSSLGACKVARQPLSLEDYNLRSVISLVWISAGVLTHSHVAASHFEGSGARVGSCGTFPRAPFWRTARRIASSHDAGCRGRDTRGTGYVLLTHVEQAVSESVMHEFLTTQAIMISNPHRS